MKRRGIAPAQVLLVGNDMLNDVLPAWKTGMRTALFAGDERSLRLREGDPRLDVFGPDLVLTDLGQLPEGLTGGRCRGAESDPGRPGEPFRRGLVRAAGRPGGDAERLVLMAGGGAVD